MSKLEALKELEGKVVADLATAHNFAAVWPSENGYGKCTWHDAHKAYNGSLDAAKALHETVLPGFVWMISGNEADVYEGECGPRGSAESDDPARAWLLAIIRALIAIEEVMA